MMHKKKKSKSSFSPLQRTTRRFSEVLSNSSCSALPSQLLLVVLPVEPAAVCTVDVLRGLSGGGVEGPRRASNVNAIGGASGLSATLFLFGDEIRE